MPREGRGWDMDIECLRTFIAAAVKENFRAASEALFISQPTVSVHVRQLEEELGVALFERRGRHVQLSAAGRRFLREARRIVEAHDDNLQQFRSWLQGYTGTLTLGVSPLVAASVLPRIVAKFSGAHPEVELRIRVMESFEIEDALSDLAVDIGLSRTAARQRNITATPLYDDRIVCVVPTADVDLDGQAASLEELLDTHRVLTHNHPGYWDDLLAQLRRVAPHMSTMMVTQVHITKRFIEEGLGISFLPASTIVRERLEGRLASVPAPGIRLPVAHTFLMTRASVSPAVVQFVSFVERLKATL